MDKPKINILDCTLRDGGYYNNWDFKPELVSAYLRAVAESHIDVVEIGFRFSRKKGYVGPFGYTPESFLNSMEIPEALTLGIMLNASDVISQPGLLHSFPQADRSKANWIRIAAHLKEVARCETAVTTLLEKGYRVGLNVMQVGLYPAHVLREELACLEQMQSLDVLYFADSLGNMDSEDVTQIYDLFRDLWSGPIGIHAHDNMGRALDNTNKALSLGATWADATVLGMGRGAGNVPLENLLISLNDQGIGDYDYRPIVACSKNHFAPMKAQFNWGSNSLYYLAALKGIHPTYIQHLLSEERYDVEDILTVINSLEGDSARSYSEERITGAISAELTQTDGDWSAASWTTSDTAILVAAGQSGALHFPALQQLATLSAHPVLSLNYIPNLQPAITTAIAACHPTRLKANIRHIAASDIPLIAPSSAFSPSSEFRQLNLKLCDYGANVTANKLAVRDSGCDIPSALVFAYALCIASAAGIKRVLLFGFDGYAPADPRHQESVAILKLFEETNPDIHIEALTPTTLPVEQSSVYAELADYAELSEK